MDGAGFPMEMHFVHFKARHQTIKDALKEGEFDSLAVIGVFFKVCQHLFDMQNDEITIIHQRLPSSAILE